MSAAKDAWDETAPDVYALYIQKALNILYFDGIEPVLITTPPTCCQRENLYPLIKEYNQSLRTLARIIDIMLVDVEKAFVESCSELDNCDLISDGLHPSSLGYELIAELVSASILGINLETGLMNVKKQLADKLEISESVLVIGRRF